MNICESCGKKTKLPEFWGIAHCNNCVKKYNKCTILAHKELAKIHNKEFEKLRDKYIDEVFKK